MKIFSIIICTSVIALAGCSGFNSTSSGAGATGQSLCLAKTSETVFAAPVTNPTACVTQVQVTWTAPTTNTDGSPLTNLAGFNIYYGTAAGSFVHEINVPDRCAGKETILNLAPATYYFVMTAYNTIGTESGYSTPVATKNLSPCALAHVDFSRGPRRIAQSEPKKFSKLKKALH